ncbi:hypothetical protein [Magnetovibrio blakemorei]|uniref:Uncharacterized protein n=1 Tax=Magnetovibrio blakemorei TaxID=28181 RepID=A0A1E5QBA3_9PROT|nr:hypothetical protein [Magnetovibrio blakemorei]OEJ69231.1 hypothetical protein BEN30_03855 [Magnetovibrio blakemorei]
MTFSGGGPQREAARLRVACAIVKRWAALRGLEQIDDVFRWAAPSAKRRACALRAPLSKDGPRCAG